MAAFTQAYKTEVGAIITVNGGASPVVDTDTLVINGNKQSIFQWRQRGFLRLNTVVGNVNTYHIVLAPEKMGNQAGG